MKLYIKELLNKPIPEDINDFFTLLFSKDDNYIKITTYFNIECNDIQYYPLKQLVYRSFEEMFLLTKTYYPELTIESFFEKLMNYCKLTHNFLQTLYCDDIKKMTFYKIKEFYNIYGIFDNNNDDDIYEFCNYNWKILFASINVFNNNDLEKFYGK